MSKTYIEENRGFITASKLKCFLKNPQEYYLQYVKEIELEDEEEKRHFVVGTAFDDLVSYGEKFFLAKYNIEEKFLKDELKAQAIAKGEISASIISKRKVPELRAYLFPGTQDKIRITPKEGEDIMGMYREVKRQPIADFGNDNYEKQKVVICNYKSLKLKGKLDRFNLEENMIRDWKTTGRFDNFEYDLEETFDYVLSMAFYFILVKIEYNIDCDVILDVLHKNSPYQFVAYRLEKDRLLQKATSKIKPGLEALIKAYETNVREPIDPLTGIEIPRSEATKSKYYQFMDCALQKDFLSPM